MVKGDSFSTQFIVTTEIHEGFMRLFKDRNPLHTSQVFARAQGFEKMVMHGNILSGFLSYFVGECLPVKNVMILSQEISFSMPVYLHDCLDFRAEITDVHESVHTVEFKFHFQNSEIKRVARGKIQIRRLE
jgi:3-hydroxybutyryl-CoA dehydratase